MPGMEGPADSRDPRPDNFDASQDQEAIDLGDYATSSHAVEPSLARHMWLAEDYESLGCLREAGEHYRAALTELSRIPDAEPELASWLRLKLAAALCKQDDVKGARQVLDERRCDSPTVEAAACLYLALIQVRQGDEVAATKELGSALMAATAVSENDRPQLVPHAVYCTMELLRFNRACLARELLPALFPNLEQITDPEARQELYWTSASVYRESGRPAEAVQLLTSALAELPKEHWEGAVVLLDAQAAAKEESGEPHAAMQDARRAVTLTEADARLDHPLHAQAVACEVELLLNDFQLITAQKRLKEAVAALRTRLLPEAEAVFGADIDPEEIAFALEYLDPGMRDWQIVHLQSLCLLLDHAINLHLEAAAFVSDPAQHDDLRAVTIKLLEIQQRLFAVFDELGIPMDDGYTGAKMLLWCEQTGRISDAERLEEERIAQLRDNREAADILQLALLRCRKGERMLDAARWPEAELELGLAQELLQQLPRMRRSLTMIRVLIALGRCAEGLEAMDDAEQHFRCAYEMLNGLGRHTHPYTLAAVQHLAEISWERKRSDENIRWEKEAKVIKRKLTHRANHLL